LALAWQTRRNAEAGQPRTAARDVDQDIGRLEVLMDQPSSVHLTYRRRESNGDMQELAYLHRPAEQPLERLTAGVLEQQHEPSLAANKADRPRRPGGVKVSPQRVFMLEVLE
jgi:hypothetical protein